MLYKSKKTIVEVKLNVEGQPLGRLRKEQILKITSPCLVKAVYSWYKVKQWGEIRGNCISLTKQLENDFERYLYIPTCIKGDFIKKSFNIKGLLYIALPKRTLPDYAEIYE